MVGIAALCGCGYHGRTPVAGFDPIPPVRYVDPPTPTTVDPPPAAPDSPGKFDPPPPRVDRETSDAPRPTLDEAVSAVNGALDDVFFGYDQFDLSSEAVAALRHDAELLRAIMHDFPQLKITVEGHCDERGSAEYNLGLGDRRATRAAGFLHQFGLPATNFVPVSYGKEAPQCTEATESCWRRNRRAHFVVRVNATN